MSDNLKENIRDSFAEVSSYIEECLKVGNTLVHCRHGSSRSPSFVIAFMMEKQKMEFVDAYKAVKEERPSCSPNQSFVRQLMEFNDYLNALK